MTCAPSMALAHHLGFELAGQSFRLVEMRSSGGYPMVLRADSCETSEAFGSTLLHSLPFDRNLAREFISQLAAFLHRRPNYANRVSILVPELLPVMTRLPIDTELSESEKQKHLRWECRQLLGLERDKDVQALFHPLYQRGNTEFHLAVAFPRATTDFLRKTFEHLTYHVESIDISHFTVEQVILSSTPECGTTTTAVFGFQPTHCTVGVYDRNDYLGVRVGDISYKEQFLNRSLSLLDDILRLAGGVIIRQIQLYGEAASEDTSRSLESLLQVPVRLFQPLDGIPFVAGSEQEYAAKMPAQRFTSALCAARKALL